MQHAAIVQAHPTSRVLHEVLELAQAAPEIPWDTHAPEDVREYIARGGDVNARWAAQAEGWTLLHHYVIDQKPALAALLLESKADVNAQSRWSPAHTPPPMTTAQRRPLPGAIGTQRWRVPQVGVHSTALRIDRLRPSDGRAAAGARRMLCCDSNRQHCRRSAAVSNGPPRNQANACCSTAHHSTTQRVYSSPCTCACEL